jgi:hypothetical protein
MPIEDTVTLGIIGVNIILTMILFVIYSRNYRAIGSKMVLGLLFFAAAFLVENILNFIFYNSLLNQGIYGVTTFITAVSVLELIGLLVLLYVTWK